MIQRFVDQSISLNFYHNTVKRDSVKIDIREVFEDLVASFNLGIKTWYYANFLTNKDRDGIDEKELGCESGGCSV